MKTRANHKRIGAAIRMQLIAMTALLFSSCGIIGTNNPSTTCTSGTVQIQVYENMMKRICGCSESSNATFIPGQTLTCTMNVGTQVHFNFISLTSLHTVGVTGGTPPTTGTYGPSNSTQTSVIMMNNTGTFSFTDVTTGGGGTFIVN